MNKFIDELKRSYPQAKIKEDSYESDKADNNEESVVGVIPCQVIFRKKRNGEIILDSLGPNLHVKHDC